MGLRCTGQVWRLAAGSRWRIVASSGRTAVSCNTQQARGCVKIGVKISFREIPGGILEAARMDGAGLKAEILYVLTPMALPGIASTVLLNIILAWNEAFWTILLTTVNAAPLTSFIASFSAPEGLFYAKLSAASMMAIAPILVMGWFSQKQLVRGLTFGAVK